MVRQVEAKQYQPHDCADDAQIAIEVALFYFEHGFFLQYWFFSQLAPLTSM